jgi:lysyl-tRNA synthetase class 2
LQACGGFRGKTDFLNLPPFFKGGIRPLPSSKTARKSKFKTMDLDNDQIQQRLKKLEELKAKGISPFGKRFEVTHHAKPLLVQYEKEDKESLEKLNVTCQVAGRILGYRGFGKTAFMHIQDETGKIQIYTKKGELQEDHVFLLDRLDLGDYIGANGKLFRTKTNELTLHVEEITLLSKSLRPPPEKWHGLSDVETRYRQRYVDLFANSEVQEVFRKRNRIIQGIRTFLNSRGFLEVETPMMHSIAGGAAARPFETHHNALDIPLFLRIAPELYLKRLLVGGFEKIYEINRNFRNEGISTIHNPEFTMLEFYVAYADFKDLIPLTEELIVTLAKETLETLTFSYGEHQIDLTPPWNRFTYREAIQNTLSLKPEQLQDRTEMIRVAEKLGKILSEIFEHTVETTLVQPTFITEYPIEISPLAKRNDQNPLFTDRFELYIGTREIANAFSELNDPIEQKSRFEEQMAQREAGDPEAHQMDEDFIRALEYGMPPAAGEGIGIDRLVMLLTQQYSIRDVIFFPQLKPEGR